MDEGYQIIGILISPLAQMSQKLTMMMIFQRCNSATASPLVKSVYQKIIFLIYQPKHMLWVLKRTVSTRRFF